MYCWISVIRSSLIKEKPCHNCNRERRKKYNQVRLGFNNILYYHSYDILKRKQSLCMQTVQDFSYKQHPRYSAKWMCPPHSVTNE